MPNHAEFSSVCARFLQDVTEVLEINQLNGFHFRYVLGKLCSTQEEAQKLMWPLFPEETKKKMLSLAQPSQWKAVQSEFILGNFACESRVAVIDLMPHEKLLPTGATGGAVFPHITFHADYRGLDPIDVADFDARAFIENVRENHTKEILSKLAPHLSES